MSLPHYYSSLKPFRETFDTGRPLLTYHHVGPRQRGARLRGLYVSARLFARQAAELRAAGFTTAPYDEVTTPVTPAKRQVLFTFDDGFWDVWEHALPVLTENRFTGIQFLVADLVGKTNEWQQRVGDVRESLMNDSQVREWIARGQQIGSHTLTHPRLSQISPAAAREEITASKKALEDRFGVRIEHFCYPYGDYNPAVRDMVAAAGYRSACTTRTGINTGAESPFELKRFTARYPSRNLKELWRRWSAWTR